MKPARLSEQLRDASRPLLAHRCGVMGSVDHATSQPWISEAMAANTIGFDSLCAYCLTASAATFATVPLIIPEVRAVLRQVTHKANGQSRRQDTPFAYLAESARRSA